LATVSTGPSPGGWRASFGRVWEIYRDAFQVVHVALVRGGALLLAEPAFILCETSKGRRLWKRHRLRRRRGGRGHGSRRRRADGPFAAALVERV